MSSAQLTDKFHGLSFWNVHQSVWTDIEIKRKNSLYYFPEKCNHVSYYMYEIVNPTSVAIYFSRIKSFQVRGIYVLPSGGSLNFLSYDDSCRFDPHP